MSLKVVTSLMRKLRECHFADVFHWLWIVKSSQQNKIRNDSLHQSKDVEEKKSFNALNIEFSYSLKSLLEQDAFS